MHTNKLISNIFRDSLTLSNEARLLGQPKVSNEIFGLFKKKEKEIDDDEIYILSFPLSPYKDDICNSWYDLMSIIKGEDKDDGLCNAFWSYTDTIGEYFYYKNENDASDPKSIKSLDYNLKYFWDHGEKAKLNKILSNLNKKCEPYEFKMPPYDSDFYIEEQTIKFELGFRAVYYKLEDILEEIQHELYEKNQSPTYPYQRWKKLDSFVQNCIKYAERSLIKIFDKIKECPKKEN